MIIGSGIWNVCSITNKINEITKELLSMKIDIIANRKEDGQKHI